jgi:hypothetical protein
MIEAYVAERRENGDRQGAPPGCPHRSVSGSRVIDRESGFVD